MPKLKTYYDYVVKARFTKEQRAEILAYQERKGIATIAGAIRELVDEGLDRERRRQRDGKA